MPDLAEKNGLYVISAVLSQRSHQELDVQIQPLEQGNLSARAYYSIREGLIAGNFKPGERLIMQDLAERLGTSVTPVREACLRLVSERGLELRSGRFATVPALTRSRYLEVRTIRIALEGLAAEMATQNVTEADLVKLTGLHQQFDEADRKGAIALRRCSITGSFTSRCIGCRAWRCSQRKLKVCGCPWDRS